MKKTLLAMMGIALLAVGCNKNDAPKPKPNPGPAYSLSFPDAIDYYDDLGLTGVTLPDYGTNNEEATVEFFDDLLESEDVLEARITGSSKKEMKSFVNSLKKNGWSMTQDDYDDFYGSFKKNELAQIYVQDWTLASYDDEENIYDAIRIFFQHGPIPTPVWPEDELQDIFEEYEETYFEAPVFVGENALFTAEVYYYFGMFPMGGMVVVYDATDIEIDYYVEHTLPEAGWEVTGDSEYGSATKTFIDLNGIANIEFGMDGTEFLIILDFGLSQIPFDHFPTDEIAAAFTRLGLPAFTLVAPDGEGYTYNYLFDEYNLNYLNSPTSCYDYVRIHHVTPAQFAAYQEKLVANGWSTKDEASPFNYYKHFETQKFTAHIKVAYSIADGAAEADITITLYYIAEEDPLDAWPADEIAAMLGEGITDVLPSAQYQDSTYRLSSDGVIVYVSDEYKEDLVTNYKSVLSTAGFIANEQTGIYTSPNSQFKVKLGVDDNGNMTITLLVPGFISRNAQAVLESKGLEGETVPDFSSLEDYFDKGSILSNCYKIWLNGDHEEAIKTILGSDYNIPETPSGSWGYECINTNRTIEIDFKYDSEIQQTIVWFYYYPDIA